MNGEHSAHHFLTVGSRLPPGYFNPPDSGKGESVKEVVAFVPWNPGATVDQCDKLYFRRVCKSSHWVCIDRIHHVP